MRARDFQKSKVYRAEDSIISYDGDMTFPEVHDFLRSIISSRWWRNRYPGITEFVVINRGAKVTAYGSLYRGKAQVELPRWAWQHLVILHELTHALTRSKAPWHGREFCSIYLQLIKHFISWLVWREMKEAFKQEGVKYVLTPACKPRKKVS